MLQYLNMDADEVLDLHSDYLRLSNKDKLMSIYREMDDEIYLLDRLYQELKWYGLANQYDISNILQQEEKLKNLNNVLYETADKIGRLNSNKTQLENEIEERMKMIGVYDSMMTENGQETNG